MLKWIKGTIICGLIGVCLILALVVRATPKASAPSQVTYNVTQKTLGDTLYFSGILQPRDVVNVPSPVEGIVTTKSFEYGQQIVKGQTLLVINSEELTKQYTAALNEFLSAKDKFSNSQTELKSSKELLSLGIISKSEYNSAKSNFDNSRISYQRSLYSLKNIIKGAHGSVENIEKLDISNFAEVDKALRVKYDDLKITAPVSGIALLAQTESGSTDSNKILEGTKVKTGQVLLSIGDMGGISADISVNEVDIEKIKPGQDVEITGVAFPDVTLKGKVSSVASQATSTSSGGSGLPSFPVKVVVANMSKEQQPRIKVGMTVKVKLILPRKQAITVPLASLTHKSGKDWLRVIKDNKQQNIEVVTGDTNHDTVEIVKGLQPNDVIVYNREV